MQLFSLLIQPIIGFSVHKGLPAFFPHFSTALTGTHHDLAHLSVLLLLALLSQLLRGGSTHASTAARAELHQKLACSALVTLGQILALLDGPLLGLAAPRAREILADAALSNSAQVSSVMEFRSSRHLMADPFVSTP